MRKQIQIRQAQPEDAEQLVAYVQQLTEEPDLDIVLEAGEFQVTVEEEAAFVRQKAAQENSIFLVAEAEGEIVGILICNGGHRRAIRHLTHMSMSVAAGWRNQGIGSRLMKAMIDWADNSGVVSRIELFVFARNAPAIHLYEKYGFEIEGRRRRVIYRDGRYFDNLMMARLK